MLVHGIIFRLLALTMVLALVLSTLNKTAARELIKMLIPAVATSRPYVVMGWLKQVKAVTKEEVTVLAPQAVVRVALAIAVLSVVMGWSSQENSVTTAAPMVVVQLLVAIAAPIIPAVAAATGYVMVGKHALAVQLIVLLSHKPEAPALVHPTLAA